MIDELKLVLDSIGDLTGIALWVVGLFIVFKLVMYLSTTGAIVYCFKLGVEKLHSILIERSKPKKALANEYDFRGLLLGDEVKADVEHVFRMVISHTNKDAKRYASGNFFTRQAKFLRDAVMDKIKAEQDEGKL